MFDFLCKQGSEVSLVFECLVLVFANLAAVSTHYLIKDLVIFQGMAQFKRYLSLVREMQYQLTAFVKNNPNQLLNHRSINHAYRYLCHFANVFFLAKVLSVYYLIDMCSFKFQNSYASSMLQDLCYFSFDLQAMVQMAMPERSGLNCFTRLWLFSDEKMVSLGCYPDFLIEKVVHYQS